MRKDTARLECYGTVDELNSLVGLAAVSAGERPELAELAAILERVQHELFNLGSTLATSPGKARARQARITEEDVAQLETGMDRITAALPPLTSFVLPGGARINAELHVCRTVCRRAERRLVAAAREEEMDGVSLRYLNRLSDAFFVWSRWTNLLLGVEERLWSPNKAAGGRES